MSVLNRNLVFIQRITRLHVTIENRPARIPEILPSSQPHRQPNIYVCSSLGGRVYCCQWETTLPCMVTAVTVRLGSSKQWIRH